MAVNVGNTPLPGYPMPFGEKYAMEFDHSGPSSYTQFVSPSTGGDITTAISVGMGGFDDIDAAGGVDTTGQIACYAIKNFGGNGNAVPSVILIYYSLVTASLGGQAQTANTQIVATTNLSTFSWRLSATMV